MNGWVCYEEFRLWKLASTQDDKRRTASPAARPCLRRVQREKDKDERAAGAAYEIGDMTCQLEFHVQGSMLQAYKTQHGMTNMLKQSTGIKRGAAASNYFKQPSGIT